MATTKDVSMTTPVQFQPELQSIERRRRMAEMLQQQALQQDQGQTVPGGIYVPPSPIQGVAKLAQALMANKGMEEADQQQKDLAEAQNKYMADQASDLAYATTPRPAVPEQNFGKGDDLRNLKYIEHTGEEAPDLIRPAEAAYNPGEAEFSSAMIKYLNNIGQPAKAAEYVISDARNKMLVNALTGGGASPAQAGAADQGSATTTPGAAPQQSAFQMLPPEQQQIVLGYLKAGKPEEGIKAMNDYLKPHVTADGRVVTMRNGKVSVPSGSVDAYTEFTRAGKQFESPISLNTESGATVQLSPTEWADYQRTGKLPLRFLPEDLRNGLQKDADESGVAGNVNIKTPQGTVGGQLTPRLGVSQTPQQKATDESIGKLGGEKLVEGQTKASEMAEGIRAIDKSLDLIQQGAILGKGADLKTDAAKVLNNVFGMEISPDKVANTDFLRSTLGIPLIAKAKSLGINPSNADTNRLDAILGNIGKDPKALPELLKFNRELAVRSIEEHNRRAGGVKSPYPLTVEVPPPYVYTPPASVGSPVPAKPNAGAVDIYTEFGLKRPKK